MTNMQIALIGAWLLTAIAWLSPKITGMGAFVALACAMALSLVGFFVK